MKKTMPYGNQNFSFLESLSCNRDSDKDFRFDYLSVIGSDSETKEYCDFSYLDKIWRETED